jgi:hypothetical protein
MEKYFKIRKNAHQKRKEAESTAGAGHMTEMFV